MKRVKIILGFFFLFSVFLGYTQDDLKRATLRAKLDALSTEKPGLNETTKIDVAGLTLYELITSLSEEHELNVDVDPALNTQVVSNFYDVTVKDILLFLIEKHNIDVEIVNSIMVFRKKVPIKELPKLKPPKIIDITYNKQNQFLSVKLKNDSLPLVAQKITDLSNKNIVLSPTVKTEKVSAYIINRPFDQVVEMLAKSNNLELSVDDNGFYYLDKMPVVTDQAGRNPNRRTSGQGNKSKAIPGELEIEVSENGYLNIKAFDASVSDVISLAAEKSNINYFMYDVPGEEKTTLVVNGIAFDDLMAHVFKGKKYTFRKKDDFYLIGKEDTQGLRSTELIQLQNRTIESVLETIPASLLEGVEIKEFLELNGLMVSGSKSIIDELKEYITKIDQVVPLVQIEVLIVQYQKSYEIQTGIKAGLDSDRSPTSGVLFPSTDVSMNATSVNSLIDAFNGFGIINIGKVAENFYLNLKALENNSIINLKSTPKIATLSGHEARVSIGETSYYFEQTNNIINSGINNNILQSGRWSPTEANLSVVIKPFVSKDEHITLTINVENSSFLGRAGEGAPPGKASQQFESLIRVKNNEMILLGGLDELEKENSGTGTPLLSRIPIIKWFFSSKKKKKNKSKLHVFIKPTVIY